MAPERPQRGLLAQLALCACALPLGAAEPAMPPVPDPYGLGQRLALIDYLQQTFKVTPAQGATLEELAALYRKLSEQTRLAGRGSDELLARDRMARLRRELKDGFAISPPETAGEDELVRLLVAAKQKASDQALQEVLAHAAAAEHGQGRATASEREADQAARARQARPGGPAGGAPGQTGAVSGLRAPPAAAPGSLEERLKAAVVLLVVKGRGTGTGFFITATGLLVTNAHVVGDGKAETIALWDGGANHAPVKLEPVKLCPLEDLALLRASEGGSYAALTLGEHYELTRPLLAAGFPLAGAFAQALQTSPSDIVITRGALSAVRHRGPVAEWLQHDCKLASGNSGGPLIDQEDGCVIGVNSRVVEPGAVGGHGEAMSLAIPMRTVVQCFGNELGR